MRSILPFLLLAVSCATEEGIQADWDAFVAAHRSCDVADDCAVVYPGCPLGCFTAVRADAAGEAEALAQRLITRWERGGRSCAYGCLEADAPTCDDRVCRVEAVEP